MSTLQPCPRCGKPNPAPTYYCPACGWELRPADARPPAARRRAGRPVPPKRSGAFACAGNAWGVIELVGWVAQIVFDIIGVLG